MGWVLHATEEAERISEWRKIIAICIALGVIASAVVISRLYIRYKNRGLASDDWVSFVSMVFSIIYSAMCIAQTRYGLGLPLRLRPQKDLVTYTRINYAGRPFYQLGISFFKIALLISYLRLLNGTDHSRYRAVVWFTIVAVFLSHFACTLVLIFACKPVAKSWNPYMDGSCLAPGPSFTGYAVVTIVADIVVAVLPVPVLWKLEIRLSKKLGLIGIFGLGIFTTVCGIMRYTQIDRITDPNDGNSTMLVLWGTIEFNVGVSITKTRRSTSTDHLQNMVSSLPFLAPIFLKKARQYRSKHSDEYNTPNTKSRSHHGFKSSNAYKLKDMSHGRNTTVFASAANKSRSGSEENILQGSNGIMKSVTYTVEMGTGGAGGKDGTSTSNSVGSTYT
ncbi:hypothetical protein CEP53_015127 [Fusarium sp. AF-6]|nr:hypothetical protein CEP53_015127 [Fusarium sp. AF-6]